MKDDGLSIPKFLIRKKTRKRPAVDWQPPPQERTLVWAPGATAPRRAEARRPRDQASPILTTIEGMIDDVMYDGVAPLSVYDLLVECRAAPVVAKAVVNKFTPVLDEFRAIRPGCDPQLREGYSRWTRARISKMVDLVGAIIGEAERYAGNNSAARPMRLRKHRQRSAQRQVEKLQYLREHGELRLVSLEPTKVVGAAVLWTYDVKRRLLCMYVSSSRTGFAVRGTTIHNIDAEASSCKTLRKPAETLAALLSAGKRDAPAIIAALKTKPSVPAGRVNKSTILLRSQ